LAVSFGTYGLIRKTARLGAFDGLLLETLLVLPLAGFYLAHHAWIGDSAFVTGGATLRFLLALAGVITAGPLLLFSMGARRVPLSQMGLLQYLSPTIQFCLGVFLWHESFPATKLVGYVLIWVALGLYALEGLFAKDHRSV
jgi:chloramphenicol-sensitive protein RarD